MTAEDAAEADHDDDDDDDDGRNVTYKLQENY